MEEITHGTTRSPVILIGNIALKYARDEDGRRCNLFEASLYASSDERHRSMLCPVHWISGDGSLLIMSAARPATDADVDEIIEACLSSYSQESDTENPFETKPSDWDGSAGNLSP